MPVGSVANKRIGARWWLPILLVCSVVLAAGPSGIASARPLVTGVNGVGDLDPPAAEKARDAGARMVGISVPWSEVAPEQRPSSWQPGDPADPNYDWARVDAAVTDAVAGGLTPLLRVEEAPAWAQRCHTGRVCDPDPDVLALFAKAAAARYSGSFGGLPRVRLWQGLNEPNLSLYFNPQFKGESRPPQACIGS